MAERGNLIPLHETIFFDGKRALSWYEGIRCPSSSYVLEGLDAWGAKAGTRSWVGPFPRHHHPCSKVKSSMKGRGKSVRTSRSLPLLRQWMAAFRLVLARIFPLPGGLVGYLNYER